MQIKIVLEWFLNPDHLPLIYGIQNGNFASSGFEVSLKVPQDHYDGFIDIANGEAEMATTEPLHLVEHYEEDLLSLGCFFETSGGILIKKESLKNFFEGKPIRITTPAANPFTDKLAFELLKSYQSSKSEQKSIDIEIVQRDFLHIKNLKEGFDAAWLCFENFEGVEAEIEGVDVVMIDTAHLNVPNISALELITSKTNFSRNKEAYLKFIATLNAIIQEIQEDQEKAKALYYEYSKESPSELMDRIIDSTIEKFSLIELSSKKWHALYKWIETLGLTNMSEEQFASMFIQ